MATVPQNLPTLTVTDQTTWDRLMAAFNSSGADYKAWLRQAVRDEVRNREVAKMQAANEQAVYARIAEFSGFLDTAT